MQGRSEGTRSQNWFDVVVIGAGFAGLYALHRLRNAGHSVRVLEAGEGIGGTWYWNRYPGARCDVESVQYSYSFSDEIQQEWNWSQRYAPQPEILEYINYVADRLELRRDIQLSTEVALAKFDEVETVWRLETRAGESFVAKYLVMATGCLSIPIEPELVGLNRFRGELYRTSSWPHKPTDFTGKSVGLIGTGSSGIQATPRIAEQAGHLYVFQRTPNYSIPAQNHELDEAYRRDWKENYDERRRAARQTRNNTLNKAGTGPGEPLTPEERHRVFEERWALGGIGFMYGFTDMTSSKVVNEEASAFVRSKIAEIVDDPGTADTLMPKDYPIGAKRICVDTDYFQAFNRANVTLVDVKDDPIDTITETGLRTEGSDYQLDMIVLATGFDAMTGALTRINPVGRNGVTLKDKWNEGPKTYLGMAISGFPNMFVITGPGSPSVFSNMVTSIEQNVDWVTDCIEYMALLPADSIEANRDAEEAWASHVNETASKTLITESNSWYVGANIPGKPRVFMPYLGGTASYAARCDEVAREGYTGFTLA